ncbi:MAG: hypothetical protein U1F76_14360 [Candidatus Competibacteraceae bacterium]
MAKTEKRPRTSAARSGTPKIAAADRGLVVPIDVVAFCVSESDGSERTNKAGFSGATIDYGNLIPKNSDAYLGASAHRSLDQTPLHSLEAGVHLHWALPDALTRGTADGSASLAFPAAPNRWLVTRFVINGDRVTPTSFVVESDALSEKQPDGQYAPLMPIQQPNNDKPDFRYLGRRSTLADYSKRRSALVFAKVTGGPLTAVANGLPSFAAYYPESRSSFGFLDTLSDLNGPAQLMYVVTGWFQQESDDPVQRVAKKPKKQALAGSIGKPPSLPLTYGWAAGADEESTPAYTLYSGTVQAVAWNRSGSYVPHPDQQPVITAEAAIANTPSEALAAYFRHVLNQPSTPYFEQILTAFQQGQWAKLVESGPDMPARIAESLHTSQFQRIDSNQLWTIFQTDPDGAIHEAIDLPPGIAGALHEANLCRQRELAVANHVRTFQWRVFTDWYRYFSESDSNKKTLIYNHFGNVLLPVWGSDSQGLKKAWQDAKAACEASDKALARLVKDRSDLSLREVPGPRYWQPTDPSLLLTGKDLALSPRYGGDREQSKSGLLDCRTADAIVTAVSIKGVHRIAKDYAAVTQLNSNALPYKDTCEALLGEALLLDTSVAAAWSGAAEATLRTALQALLAGETQSEWTIASGTPPSPVEINWWEGKNPWIPLFLHWTAAFVPLQPTIRNQKLEHYDPAFFTANYEIDLSTGSFLSYTPSGEQGSISIDPAQQSYTSTYEGQAILSDKAVANLDTAISTHLQETSDDTFKTLLKKLRSQRFVVQPLAGFTEALVNRVLQAQCALVAPPKAKLGAQQLTQEAASIVGDRYSVGPSFNTPYNPIRAGYLKVSAFVVDTFGQRRQVKISKFYTAESMTVVDDDTQSGIAYVAPRIAQPSRLVFDWMMAGARSITEMARHPTGSPVCGWLLPNSLTRGFFLYDSTGRPLGALQLDGASPRKVVWQSAPGDNATIDKPVDQALADANPLLRELALSLSKATSDDFQAFFHAVDTAHGTINPQNLSLESGFGVLAGRPVALVQAALRLELRGRPLLNQNFACLTSKKWTDTENGLSTVRFPVLLGDADRLNDGLVGFFRQAEGRDGFDLTTFFSAGADPDATRGVVRPDASTLQLTLTPTADDPDPPPPDTGTKRVLMLVDPRAPVHAVTGILPTEALVIPSDIASEALSSLDLYFLAAPVLKPRTTLSLPAPTASGFDSSFIEQRQVDGAQARQWSTIADIAATTTGAVWAYTPQSLTEGWLRLNQTQLTFRITDAAGKAVVIGGATQKLTLTVTNRKPNSVTFTPGVLAPEGESPRGSVFYLHFGGLVAPDDVPNIEFSAAGWNFASFQRDAIYGAYWAATPRDAIKLEPAAALTIAVTGLKAADNLAQARLYFDYYRIDGTADGVFTDTVVVSTSN